MKHRLKVIPIGGFGEIGKNMLLLQYGDSIIVIDAGLMFPDGDMLGIDFVIPDISYLLANKDKVKALILTHGHEDHIGALQYILKDLNVPIYGTSLTLGLVEKKLEEFRLKANLNKIKPNETINIGPFTIETFRQTHSIPDTIGLAITTPIGLIVISGDFKLDQTPIDGNPPDFNKLVELGERGVLALFCDSTNVEQPGITPSESLVKSTFEGIFSSTKSRIFLVTFASNFHRIQQAIDMASKFGRKVAIAGKSLINNIEVATKLGYLHIPENILINIKDVNNLPDEKVLVLTTGSQGEPYSALSLLTNHSYKQLFLKPGDTVILSTKPIPGNEIMVYKMVDQLFRKGVEVIYGKDAGVHVSGHAAQEEIKMFINLLKPKYLIPYHGEYRHLALLKKIGLELGISKEHIIIIENGTVLEFDEEKAIINGRINLNNIYVDGLSIGDVGNIVLMERKKLAEDGVLIVGVLVDGETGLILEGPEIISKGFIFVKESEELIETAKEKVREAFKKKVGRNGGINKETLVREVLENFFNEELKRKPVVVPLVWEI
ncbi:MAG: ribonuclease J [Dictyoglomus turgidum]|uniref:ribonuclease J n=1 Tax=Dictyoglomus turgidum TaxID=513050 RepID=UPI003C77DD84